MEGWDRVPGNADPRFAAGLPSLMPEILAFKAFRGSGKICSKFPAIFPESSSGTPEQIPETAGDAFLPTVEAFLLTVKLVCAVLTARYAPY